MHANLTSTGISIAFFGLASWFFLGSPSGEAPIPGPAELRPDALASQTRPLMPSPPTVDVGGMEMRCQACHSLFETDPKIDRELYQHQDIRLNHGLNDRCLNCHSTLDRNKLVLHGEREISFDEVEQLCAKCHGTTFRDWQKGMHGKTLGSWVSGSAEQRRLKCTECHDPHSPAFKHIVPLPGPNTLRMGWDAADDTHSENEQRNVLQHWRGHGQREAEAKKDQ